MHKYSMHVLSSYLDKQSFYCPHLEATVNSGLNIIIVIPCYDEKDIFHTLGSVLACAKPESGVEVIAVINFPEHCGDDLKKQHQQLYENACLWANENSSFRLAFHFLYAPNLRKKFAGAGWARKIGMDEAVYRFHLAGNEQGIICSLDADVTIDKNYLVEIEKLFCSNPKADGCSIYFEHIIEGQEFSTEVYESIMYYELYLRYYIEGLRMAGFPYAYHTIGSCFAVRAGRYALQGGMNKRKGGEDFYFLHKIMPLGNFHELNNTCVYPSPRPSHRVPFGTGPMIKKFMGMTDRSKEIETFDFDAFRDLQQFLSLAGRFFKATDEDYKNILYVLPGSVKCFLNEMGFEKVIDEVNRNSAEFNNFIHRFYHNFNGLMTLQYLNFSHEKFFKPKPLLGEGQKLLKEVYGKEGMEKVRDLLLQLRQIQRESQWPNLPR